MARKNYMDYVTLNNGISMPILGFGVYQILTRRNANGA